MSDLSLLITSLTAVANGLILLILTFRVIQLRRRHGIVLGDNGDRVMAKAIRGQANAAEQIPIAIIMVALIELQGGPFGLLAAMALTLTIGRLLHAIYFAVHGTTWHLRFYGMLMTIAAQVGLLLALLATLLT